MNQSISVVIPCFNRQEVIARSIESVLNQTRSPDEIIIIDDGSTDDSVAQVRRYGQRVRLIQQKNSGASKARNVGIANSRAEWIAFLDSDDVWHPTKLEKQLKAAQSHPSAGVIFCDTETSRENITCSHSRFSLGGLRENADKLSSGYLKCDRTFYRIMLRQSRVITSSAMVRRTLSQFQFPENIWGSEDWALWLSLILETDFIAIDEVLVTMEAATDNLTHLRGRGRLLRNDLLVLESLAEDKRLTCEERACTKRFLVEHRAAAIYHSLIRGETREAREILFNQRPNTLSITQALKYAIISFLPAALIRKLGASNVAESSS